MKRELIAALGGTLIVMAGLSGCSSDGESESPATQTGAATETGAAAETGAGDTRVTIDGQDQDVQGTVVCGAVGGNTNIAIGAATSGIAVVVSEGDSPTVQSVALGNVNNVTLGYQSGTGQGEANAEKDGNTYRISGTATGVDMANPMQPVTKPFEIEVACP